jgi:hypothetical protein
MDSRCNDVEELSESSEYEERLNDVKLNDLRFEYLHKPMRAKKGANVSVVLCKTRSNHSKWNILPFRKPTYWLLQEQTKPYINTQEIVLVLIL